MKMAFISLMFIVICLLIVSEATEPECSPFTYEEKLLTKMVRMDFKMEQALKRIDDFEGQLLRLNRTIQVGAERRGFCPNAWMVYEDSCYLFADETNVSWTEAIHFCQSHSHAHLVTVETIDEDMFIKTHARKLFKDQLGVSTTRNSFWMGASDAAVEGQWIWYTNQQRLNYTSFYSVGESQTADQDCLILWGSFNMGWGDYYCVQQSHAICELDIEEYQKSLKNLQVVG